MPKSVNEIALAISRSLGRHGVSVYRFHPDRSLIDLESRYCTHVPCPNLYDDEAGLIDSLTGFSQSQEERPVLYAASDGATEFIACNEERLAKNFELVCASRSCIGEIQNKRRLLERAREIGVPTPATHFPESVEEADRVAASLQYPAVIKPLTSHHWKRPAVVAVLGAVKAVVVAGPQELKEVYGKVAPLAPDMMIQEIIPGETDQLLTFLGYVDRDGKTRAGCVRKKLRQYPPGFGYCSLTETVDDPEIMELSIRLLESLGYRGIGCVEFKRDPRDSLAKLIEINARAVRTTGAAIAAGVDLPWIAYQDMVRVNPPPVFEYAVPMRWIHLRNELHGVWPSIRAGEISLWQWLRMFHGRSVMAVWAWDDLRPSILDLAQPAFYRLVRLPGGVWKKLKAKRAKDKDDRHESTHKPAAVDSVRGNARRNLARRVLSRR